MASEASGRIKRFFYLAAKEATSSEMKYRHGAIVVRGGRIISKGFNHYRRTPHSMSTHAEMAALLGLEGGKNAERKELARGSDLFVVRLGGRALEPLDSIWKRNSRPCPVCVEWMYRYGVKRVFYTVGQPTNRYFPNASTMTEASDNENEEIDELVAMGVDGKEIITPSEIDFDPLRRAEEEGMKEGWWVERVGDLKHKMERLLQLDLSRYKHRQCDHEPIPYLKPEKKECAID